MGTVAAKIQLFFELTKYLSDNFINKPCKPILKILLIEYKQLSNRLFIYTIFLFACLLPGCGPDEPIPEEIPVSTHRTVLVYLGVDNNFHPEAQQKIKTLTANWNANNDGNLFVYADVGDRPALIHIYHSNRKGNIADTLAVYPPENSAHPQSLSRVLNDVKAYRPAQSYGLTVLSHATGWLPSESSYPTPILRSVILDKGTSESNNYMELSDFAEAIPYKLDFIIFDACFMGSVEVCYELKDRADYIVASPAEVVSPGFVYASMMPTQVNLKQEFFRRTICISFNVFVAVVPLAVVTRVLTLCGGYMPQHFGGTYCLHLQGD